MTDGGNKIIKVGTTPVNIFLEDLSRKDFILSAGSSNTGKIFIGFNIGVSSNSFFVALSQDDKWTCDDYQGQLWAVADTANQDLIIGEW
jgi:hypothetical protein